MDAQIKNLLIDFGGVLVDLDRERCLRSFEKIGVDGMEQILSPYYQQGIFMKLEKGEITPSLFHNELRQLTGKEMTDQQIDDAWNSFLLTVPQSKLELLLALRKQYNIYLLSNTNAIHWDYSCKNIFNYKGYQVNDFFDKIYLSYQMKELKPTKEIFESVIKDSGLNPAETLFIDDAPANCQTADALGFRTYTPQAREDWSHLFK